MLLAACSCSKDHSCVHCSACLAHEAPVQPGASAVFGPPAEHSVAAPCGMTPVPPPATPQLALRADLPLALATRPPAQTLEPPKHACRWSFVTGIVWLLCHRTVRGNFGGMRVTMFKHVSFGCAELFFDAFCARSQKICLYMYAHTLSMTKPPACCRTYTSAIFMPHDSTSVACKGVMLQL